MTRGKAVLFGSVAVLALLLAFGCSLLQREDTGTGAGWYIQLQIRAPAAKGITVSEFDVTALEIRVLDPAGEELTSIDWAAAQGTKSYLVPVQQLGKYAIEVTHIGERNGEVVEAKESAEFSIRAMKITVIDIVPGGIGMIWVEGQETPPAFDLTGYWTNTVTFSDGMVITDLWYMRQTGSTVDCPMGIVFTLDGLTISMKAWIEDFEAFITSTGTISAGGDEINGTMTGFPFGGGTATFRMVRTDITFGQLDMEGSCGGVPILLHNDYGYAIKGETEVTYSHSFSLNWGMFWGNLWFESRGPLSAGSYPVTEDWPEEAGRIQAMLWDGVEHTATGGTVNITSYDAFGMVGTFTLNFPEGDLNGTFSLIFGAHTGQVSVSGPWLSGSTDSAYSEVNVRTTSRFTVEYIDNELNVSLFCSVNGELRTGEFRGNGAWVDLLWQSDSGPDAMGMPAESPDNYLTITRYDENGIAGSFQQSFQAGGTGTGSFDVSFLK